MLAADVSCPSQIWRPRIANAFIRFDAGLKIALDQARGRGLLGKNILGTDFDFDLQLRLV